MNIACIGCGLYAKGITSLLLENNNHITMWIHDKNLEIELAKEFNNPNLSFSTNILETIKNKDIILILVSSAYYEETIKKLIGNISKDTKIYIGTKGKLMSSFYNDYTKKLLNKKNVYSFAGPSLAKDIYNKNAVGFTVAPFDNNVFKNLYPNIVNIDYINNSTILETFSIYKNIIAIGAGCIFELTKSYSTVLTYLTKAYNEINTKLFNNENIASFGTIGDFYLTGTMNESRNYSYGKLLATNKKAADEFLKNNTVEGYDMLKLFIPYLLNINTDISIVFILNKIINENKEIATILEYLKRS